MTDAQAQRPAAGFAPMRLWRCFQEWRFERECRRLIYASADTMLGLTEERLGRVLTQAERAEMPALWGTWLCADEARLHELIDRPIRAIHLFLSEMLP